MVEARNLEIEDLLRDVRKGQCPMCVKLEGERHILLGFSETRNWILIFKCKKYLPVHEEIAHKR